MADKESWTIDTKIPGYERAFASFLTNYNPYEADVPLYISRINDMIAKERTVLYVDVLHVQDYIPTSTIFLQLIASFYYFQPIFEAALKQVIRSSAVNNEEYLITTSFQRQVERVLSISFYGLKEVNNLSSINSSHIGSLINVTGTVIRISDVQPELIRGSFRCLSCGEVHKDITQQFRYTEPSFCTRCGATGTATVRNFELLMDSCLFVDFQRIRLQESIGTDNDYRNASKDARSSSTPVAFEVILRDHLCGLCKPGDHIQLSALVLAHPDISVISLQNTDRGINKNVLSGFQISAEGTYSAATTGNLSRVRSGADEGISGLAGLGVKEISYKLILCGQHLFVRSGDIFDASSAMASGAVMDMPVEASQPALQEGIQGSAVPQHVDYFDYNANVPGFISSLVGNNPFRDVLSMLGGSTFKSGLNPTDLFSLGQPSISTVAQGNDYSAGVFTFQTLAQMASSGLIAAILKTLPEASQQKLKSMQANPSIIDDLIKSFAPHIYGHESIKLSILLQLTGGVDKVTAADNLSVRSDINIMLVGDPSTAKSMFLKYTLGFHPKAVYTSGKSSSAAGLTAAVVIDPETNDYSIEAGALIRADGGLCCIDEFEKMTLVDQTALHECLEQQSVSINKAGINITLRAKTPVLAAMNPIGSRYLKNKTLRQNISISQAILSRFDLCFVLLDEPRVDTDRMIARRIISSQRALCGGISREDSLKEHYEDFLMAAPDAIYTLNDIKLYVNFARNMKPLMTAEAMTEAVTQWSSMRQKDMSSAARSYRITIRQLESLIRLSEACAKLSLYHQVTAEHVRRAAELLGTTCVSVESEKIRFTVTLDETRRVSIPVEQVSRQADNQESSGSEYQDEAARPDKRQHPESGEELEVSVDFDELVRLCILLRYTLLGDGSTEFDSSTALTILIANLQAQTVHGSALSETDTRVVARYILDKMTVEYHWLSVSSSGKLFFTHLAPDTQ